MPPHLAQIIPITRRTLCTAAAMALAAPAASAVTTVRVSVADFPDHVATLSLIEAMRIAFDAAPGISVQFNTLPFARSLASVVAGLADLHVPMIRPRPMQGVPWAITTTTIFHVPFVLYTNQHRPIDLDKLAQYQIETDVGHVGNFDFPVAGSAGTESSLRKLVAGRIDGYLYAGNIVDPMVEALDLKNIDRHLYKYFDVCGVLPKGGADGPIDRLLTDALSAVADDSLFKAAIQKVLSGYRGGL